MSKENDTFLSLYRTYEGLLRARNTDYREIEGKSGNGRMTIMRQMRNYLAHAEDPGFITISPLCIKVLEQMVKEESLKGDIVKNHLITPAKGSIKEGTMISEVIYKLSTVVIKGIYGLPVYDGDKKLRGIITLEKAAAILKKYGNIPLKEDICGSYSNKFHLIKPEDMAPERKDNLYYCCTKDGTLNTQYMGYIDI